MALAIAASAAALVCDKPGKHTAQDLVSYASIPTFDSGGREWDSRILEFLIFDGQAVSPVVLRGGYHIAHLTFYEPLLSADCRLKTYFDKLGRPTKGINWQEET